MDGKTVYVRHLFDLKPDKLPCPTREDVMASEQPSGRREQSASSSIFSFASGGSAAIKQQLVCIATVFLLVLKVNVLFT